MLDREMILSEGVPMTNGEVFSLLRRRRDERNGKHQPSFGLQFLGNSSIAQQQSQRITAPKAGSQSMATATQFNFFYPPDAVLKSSEASYSGFMSTPPVGLLNPPKNSALLASPAASHLVVLLTEVRVLRYLSRYSTISGNDGVRAIYGPSSIYNRQPCRLRTACASRLEAHADEQAENQQLAPAAACENEEGRNEDSVDKSIGAFDDSVQAEALRLLEKHRPGTVGHVRGMESLLSLWEQQGRDAERESVARLNVVLRELQRRVGVANQNGDESPASGKDEGKWHERRPVEDRARKLFAQPTVPLAMFLSDQHPVASGASAGRLSRGGVTFIDAATPEPRRRQWTEQDVMQLVIARPKNSLDVYRVVEDLEQYTGDNEELSAFLEKGILEAFA